MPYYMKTTDAGKTREIEKRQRAVRSSSAEGTGEEWHKPSPEEIERVNRCNARRRLRLILNANYGSDDIWVTFTYRKDLRPTTAVALAHYPKLMRDIRKLYASEGIPLRYVAVTEERPWKKPHHHMVLPGIMLRKLQALWPYGHVNVRPLDASGQYRKLAEYIFVHTDIPERAGDRWKCSKGLDRPKPKQKTIKAKHWREGIKVPKGWMLDPQTEPERGRNPYNGAGYLRYTLIRLEPVRRRC
ncbi:MAG: hypothetical protein K0S22_571 [Oscillospiraceae bacterium]|jgi:hypothetical protein|nr:hypothetical protein [Oscillospiraceae bacterium]